MRTRAIKIVTLPPQRLMTLADVAHYCGRSLSRFQAECPVRPTEFPNGDRRYDVEAVDQWIDSLTGGTAHEETDVILDKLQ